MLLPSRQPIYHTLLEPVIPIGCPQERVAVQQELQCQVEVLRDVAFGPLLVDIVHRVNEGSVPPGRPVQERVVPDERSTSTVGAPILRYELASVNVRRKVGNSVFEVDEGDTCKVYFARNSRRPTRVVLDDGEIAASQKRV